MQFIFYFIYVSFLTTSAFVHHMLTVPIKVRKQTYEDLELEL